MSDDAERAERLSRELDAAFRNRADLYRLMLDECPLSSARSGPRRS